MTERMKGKGRSGTVWGDAQYAAKGYGRLTLRLPEHTLAQLADLAHERGVTRAQLIADLVDRATTRDSH
jgi:predicted DNA-binding ribbon-helix-helix protein